MRIYTINQKFYDNKFEKILSTNKYQIMENANARRPYYYSINYEEKIILLPFRSNSSSIPYQNKFSIKKVEYKRKNPAIDFTSLLVINKKDINGNLHKGILPSRTYRYVKLHNEKIDNKFNQYLLKYIKQRACFNENTNTQNSSLKYFHKELNLDKKIQEKRKQIFINEYENKGATILFNNIVQKEPNFKNLIQLMEYKKLCQNESFVDPKSDLENPKLVIRTNEKEYKSISLNKINHLVETNNVSRLNDYFLLSKTEKSNKPNKNKDNFEI